MPSWAAPGAAQLELPFATPQAQLQMAATDAANLEGCTLPCVAALTRKRKKAPAPRSVSDWSPAEITEYKRKKQRQQRSVLPVGAEMEVDMLLASRPAGTKKNPARRAYLVRWKGLDYHDDCWEPSSNIDPSLVDGFERSQLPKVSRPKPKGGTATWLAARVVERKGGRSLVSWLGYAHRPDEWVETTSISLPPPKQPAAGAKQPAAKSKRPAAGAVAQRIEKGASPTSAAASAPALPGGRPAWVARAAELLVKEKVSARMVALQVERAAEKAGEMVGGRAFDALLEMQAEMGVPEERILALQDALGL